MAAKGQIVRNKILPRDASDDNKVFMCGLTKIELANIRDSVTRALIGEPIEHVPRSLIPPSFLCPISHAIMNNPAICSDGYSYESAVIESWFRTGRAESPVTGGTQ